MEYGAGGEVGQGWAVGLGGMWWAYQSRLECPARSLTERTHVQLCSAVGKTRLFNEKSKGTVLSYFIFLMIYPLQLCQPKTTSRRYAFLPSQDQLLFSDSSVRGKT